MILCTTPSLSSKRRAMSGGRTAISRSLKIFCFSISVSRKVALIMSADIVHIAPELVQWGGIWGVNNGGFTTETRRKAKPVKPQRTQRSTKEMLDRLTRSFVILRVLCG